MWVVDRSAPAFERFYTVQYTPRGYLRYMPRPVMSRKERSLPGNDCCFSFPWRKAASLHKGSKRTKGWKARHITE